MHSHARRLVEEAARQPARAAAVLRRATVLREAIWRVFDAFAKSGKAEASDLALIHDEELAALRHARFQQVGVGVRYEWSDDVLLERPLWEVARSAADLLRSNDDLVRVRECGSDTCEWLFIDRSRNHSRRVHMNDCGNAAKVRRFRQGNVARLGEALARPLDAALDDHADDGPAIKGPPRTARTFAQRAAAASLLAALEDRRDALEQDPREPRPVLFVAINDDGDASVRLDVPHAAQRVPIVFALRLPIERGVEDPVTPHEHDRHVVRSRVLVGRREVRDARRAEELDSGGREASHEGGEGSPSRTGASPAPDPCRGVEDQCVKPTHVGGLLDVLVRVGGNDEARVGLSAAASARRSLSRGSSTPPVLAG